MANAGIRWYHAEIIKRGLTPAQKHIAFAVSFHFHVGIHMHRIWGCESINLNRVIDNEVNR